MDLLIPLDDPLALLQLALVILVPAAVSAWVGYRYGARTAGLWREALAHLPWGVVLFDRRRRVRFKNDPATPLLSQLDPATLERIHQSGGPGSHFSAVVRGPDGALINTQAWALPPNQPGIVLALRNTSQEHEQQQRTQANYQKFIHTLSHELLSPLATIQLQLGNVAGGDSADEAARRHSLQTARAETDRLIRLVSNLLVLSRLESGQPLQRRLTKINGVAEEAMAQLLENANARRVSLSLEADQNLPRVALDADAWRQVFINLIDNAIKYGQPGGAVRVEMRREDSRLRLTIADDGPGIAADDVPHLFEELFRGASSRYTSGSGLGLAIVRRIIEQHGGQISCASEPGRGTTFHITLPVEN